MPRAAPGGGRVRVRRAAGEPIGHIRLPNRIELEWLQISFKRRLQTVAHLRDRSLQQLDRHYWSLVHQAWNADLWQTAIGMQALATYAMRVGQAGAALRNAREVAVGKDFYWLRDG